MNLLLHQFRKDLRHARVLVALWLVLAIARFALVGWNADPDDYAMQRLYTTLSGLTTFLGFVLILVLMPMVIHQEPLVGTNAFWFTRPLSRLTLFGAKGLFAFLLILLPLIVQAVVFTANGVTLHDLSLALPQLALEQGAWMVTIAALAVLTPGAGRFAIVAAVLLVTFLIFISIAQTFRIFIVDSSVLVSLEDSRAVVAYVLLIGLGGAAIVRQYLTRRTVDSIVLAVLAIVSYSVAVEFWPWNFLKPVEVVVADPKFNPQVIGTPTLSSVNVTDIGVYRAGAPDKQVNGEVILPGCPPGYLIKIEQVNPSLKTSRDAWVSVGWGSGQPSFSPPESEPLTEALGGIPVMNMPQFYRGNQTPLFNMSTSDYDKVLGDTFHYQAQLNCAACKYTATAEIPVVKGARFVRGSQRETITAVLKNGESSVSIGLQKQTVTLLFAPRPEDEQYAYYQEAQHRVIYVLLNRKRNEAVVERFDISNGYYGRSDQILEHNPIKLYFGMENPSLEKGQFPTFDETWLSEAVLVRLELVRVAEFSRKLIVSDLRLDGTYHGPQLHPTPASANLEALNKITLPANANREQTRAYVVSILQASARADQFSDHDPQLGMLKQVGAQNVDLLIELARTNHSYYLNRAINDLAQDDQRDAILFALPANPDLIDTVIAHHWEKEAEHTLLTGLDPNFDRADSFALALVSLKDHTTYDALKAYYIARPDQRLFDALATLPGFDLKGMITTAWHNHTGRQIWEIRNLLGPALQFGEPGAIDIALSFATLPEKDGYTRKMASDALAASTPAIGANDDERIAWVEANKDHLVYDAATRKFVLKVTTPSVVTPPPAPR